MRFGSFRSGSSSDPAWAGLATLCDLCGLGGEIVGFNAAGGCGRIRPARPAESRKAPDSVFSEPGRQVKNPISTGSFPRDARIICL